MKVIFYDYYKSKVKTAVKARDDARIIAEKNGYISIPLFCRESCFFKKILSINRAIRRISKQLKKEKDNYVLIQYPYRLDLINHLLKKINNKAKVIFLIHDVDYIRNRCADDGEINILNKATYVIAHNKNMINQLIKDGLSKDKILNLEIFDYVSDEALAKIPNIDRNVVVFAGYLGSIKSAFIYKINPQNYVFSLYGIDFEGVNNNNVKYNGSFPSDELIINLEGHFGLVWDGNSINECTGNSGNYLKYNNPHKTSLYISAGLPVVIWKEAALSSFIVNNNIGVAIDSLEDLEKLPKFDSEEYILMKKNVLEIRNKINNGFYLTSKLIEIEKNRM